MCTLCRNGSNGNIFGIGEVCFNYADAHIPAFHRWVVNMIGEDDEWEESEV